GPSAERLDDLQWMSVLKSLTGYQMYRLEMQRAIRSDSVLRFLLQSERFPRSVTSALQALRRALEALDPDARLPRRVVPQVLRKVAQLEPEALVGEALHQLIDELQQGFAEIHGQLERRYFRPSRSAEADPQG
ncbi:MAG: alpha-E domain-containing protein, partial [Pseudomonadales bacterium]|nr:alpha-E domain-containing protein [Pseudomonadales bacterium]